MKKTILISSLMVIFALGMNSCKKCYVCTQTIVENRNNVTDSTINLQAEVCGGKNGAGARQNVNDAVQDMEATGYICTQK
jgi:hypothetical protein